MNIKKIFILLLVFTALIGLSFIYTKIKYAPAGSEYYKGIKKEDINKFDITKNNKDTCTFEKKDNKWRITAPVLYPANKIYIDEILGKVAGLKIGEVISTNKAKHESFEITDEKGIMLTIYRSGKACQPVIFGKMAGDFCSIYARYPKKDEVYLAQGPGSDELRRELNEWRDKSIFSFSKDNVDEIEIDFKGEKYELIRKEEWYLGAPDKNNKITNPNDIDTFLTELSGLTADEFVDKEEEKKNDKRTGLNKPELNVKIHFADGKEEIFKAGKKDTAKNRYYVSGNREPAVFLVQASNVEKLQKKKSDYKIEKAAGDKKPAENKDITPEIRPSQK